MFFYSPMLKQEKVFRDPILDHIHIQHQLILDLINTREFQRLRRVKQTGTSLYTFHGPEHKEMASGTTATACPSFAPLFCTISGMDLTPMLLRKFLTPIMKRSPLL